MRDRKRENEREKEEGKILESRECYFSFLLKLWRSRTGLLPLLCKAIYKNSQSKGS
jgi:hypothetical protein